MRIFVDVLVYIVIYMVIVTVHEFGHYVVARLQGVPAANARVRLLSMPPHVALKMDEQWISPIAGSAYASAIVQWMKPGRQIFQFCAAGLVGQTLVVAPVGLALWAGGLSVWAFVATVMSAAMLVFYIVFDPIMSAFVGHAAGDIGGMWSQARIVTVFTLSALVLGHAGLAALYLLN